MEVIVCKSPEMVASLVATHICEFVRSDREAVLGLATGKSPQLTYHKIIQLAERNAISFNGVLAFMLDEYIGVSDDHPGRYRNVLQDFIGRAGVREENVFALPNDWPSGANPDLELNERCQRFEDDIAKVGGIDIQLLGVSEHGHIAFNEPMSSLTSRTRVKTLTNYSRSANAGAFVDIRHFGDNIDSFGFEVSDYEDYVPIHAVTQGIGTILDSDHAILIATGIEKSKVIARAIEGPLTAFVPASALQMHRHATFVLDEDAASQLEMLEYYCQVKESKRYVQPPIT